MLSVLKGLSDFHVCLIKVFPIISCQIQPSICVSAFVEHDTLDTFIHSSLLLLLSYLLKFSQLRSVTEGYSHLVLFHFGCLCFDWLPSREATWALCSSLKTWRYFRIPHSHWNMDMSISSRGFPQYWNRFAGRNTAQLNFSGCSYLDSFGTSSTLNFSEGQHFRIFAARFGLS